ncbi:FKBP-type peptidyl-prolyl cis-trans isomerase [Verrucomicrobiaceae bacterium 227]
MPLRFLLPLLVTIGAILFLVYRSNNDPEESLGSEVGGPADQGSGKGAGKVIEGEKSDRIRSRSTRVPRSKPKVITTESGLQYEILEEGAGDSPGVQDQVEVHYHGTLEDGTVFASSIERGQPAMFPLKAVISGWIEGLQLMRSGAKYRFTIPADLAYGSRGAGSQVPPGATLIFEVELLSIKASGE